MSVDATRSYPIRLGASLEQAWRRLTRTPSHARRAEAARRASRRALAVTALTAVLIAILMFTLDAWVIQLMPPRGTAALWPVRLVSDFGKSSYVLWALIIVLALLGRERGGQGQYIDISYLDTTIALLAATPNLRRVFSQQQVPSDREGVFCGGYPYYSLYRTADARWLSVACSEPPLWSNFCDAIGLPQLARFARCAEHYQREPNAEEAAARQAVQQVIGAQTCRHWEALFADRNACVAAVRTIDEMLVDPQVAHRGLVDAVDHPQHGRIAQFASPLRLSRTPPRLRSAAPEIGEHTQQVLTSLGFDAAAMSALRERGVIH